MMEVNKKSGLLVPLEDFIGPKPQGKDLRKHTQIELSTVKISL